MFVDYTYNPMLEDYSSDGNLELYAILKILENAGNKHSALANDHAFKSKQQGRTWMLTDWYARIIDYPTYKDSLKIITWAEPKDSLFTCFRDYEFYANDKLCIKAVSKWAYIDTKTLRPIKLEDEFYNQYKPEDKKVFGDFKIPKISIPQNYTKETEITVRRTDIDYNKHVHNLQYVNYAMEALPIEVYEHRAFKTLHIAYKVAVMPEEKICGKYAFEDGSHLVNIINREGQLKTQIELI